MEKLSVIIPARNEEIRIKNTILLTNEYLAKQGYEYEIIVVVNQSTDQTEQIVRELVSTIKNLKLIVGQVPGKGGAVKTGVLEAKGEYCVFMDADNATPISEMEKFWPYLEQGFKVVIGSRYLDSEHQPKQPLFRTILSRLSILLVQIVLLTNVHDTQAGFKAFKSSAAKEIFSRITIFGFAFDMELLVIALKLGYGIKEVSIIREQKGGSTVPASAFLLSLRDLFIIKWKALIGQYNK